LKKIIREKKHRLDKEYYFGKTVSFTICIKNKVPFFISDNIFNVFEKILLNELNKFDCEAIVYLFMPDHVHLITSPKNDNSDCFSLIKMFKQKTGFLMSQNNYKCMWQKDYYDHIVRDDENLKNLIYYILYNPVRAEITDDWKKYKYRGSSVYQFEDWV
jgi:putative transposase